MSSNNVYASVASVLEKSAAYIDSLESQVAALSSGENQRKLAQEQNEIENLVDAITAVSGSHTTDDLRSKLSSATPEVRDMIRNLVGQQTDTDLGNVTEKSASGGSASYDDDPDQAFLDWVTSPST